MCSKTLLVGAVPHAALDSCQRPVQIRGTVSEPSWKYSIFTRGVREEVSGVDDNCMAAGSYTCGVGFYSCVDEGNGLSEDRQRRTVAFDACHFILSGPVRFFFILIVFFPTGSVRCVSVSIPCGTSYNPCFRFGQSFSDLGYQKRYSLGRYGSCNVMTADQLVNLGLEQARKFLISY